MVEDSLDDIINHLLKQIMKDGITQTNSKGENKELLGVYVKLTNPLNRISTSLTKNFIISPLGEFLWYLSGANELDFIQYYIKKYSEYSNDGLILNGAYGRRMCFKEEPFESQINTIVKILNKKRNSRQAVIQIFDHKDLQIKGNKDVPCTTTLQFFIRDKKLILFVSMRSNDVFVGLPHDIFSFTMLQELIAKELECELGEYHHFISSCHFYTKDLEKINKYLNEGYQTTKTQMPQMPRETTLKLMQEVLKYEKLIRTKQKLELEEVKLPNYWKDLIIILKIYSSENKKEVLENYINLIENKAYKLYLKEKYG